MTDPTPRPADEAPTGAAPVGDPPDDRRDDPPPPASEWVEEHAPPTTEAQRQAQETIRSVSRLEESN